MGVSAPVNVTVITNPPVVVTGAAKLGTDGYYHLQAVVGNQTAASFPGLRIYIIGLPASGVTVVNVTGVTNGIPFVESYIPVPPGTSFTNDLRFHVLLSGYTPAPTLKVEVIQPPAGGTFSAVGTTTPIERQQYLPNGNFVVQFTALANQIYYIEYSGDLINWKTVLPAIKGNGSKILWIDSGPPATESFPSLINTRFYRVIHAQ
jgi:hypothetical protein